MEEPKPVLATKSRPWRADYRSAIRYPTPGEARYGPFEKIERQIDALGVALCIVGGGHRDTEQAAKGVSNLNGDELFIRFLRRSKGHCRSDVAARVLGGTRFAGGRRIGALVGVIEGHQRMPRIGVVGQKASPDSGVSLTVLAPSVVVSV